MCSPGGTVMEVVTTVLSKPEEVDTEPPGKVTIAVVGHATCNEVS